MRHEIAEFYTVIADKVADGLRILSRLAARDVELSAVTAVPFGPNGIGLILVPSHSEALSEAAKLDGLSLSGPHRAILTQGCHLADTTAGILARLAAANVKLYSAQGRGHESGLFSFLIYLKPSDMTRALDCLQTRHRNGRPRAGLRYSARSQQTRVGTFGD